jgi:hypothetical protein
MARADSAPISERWRETAEQSLGSEKQHPSQIAPIPIVAGAIISGPYS